MKFTSKRIIDPEASTNESTKLSKNNDHEAVLNLGFNFKSAFSLMFSKHQADLAKTKARGINPTNDPSDLPIEHSNPLVTAAKTALKKCKYISHKQDYASPQLTTRAKLITKFTKRRLS